MGLEIGPYQNPLMSPMGSLDLNFGAPSVPLSGPAPSASAAPTVSTGGVLPALGSGLGVNIDPATATPYSGTGANLGGQNPLSQGLNWGEMPFTQKADVVLSGIGTLGKLWSAFQANKIARDSLDFQKQAFETNLSNQRASYNVALEDRANSRANYSGTPEARAAAEAYINKHRI